MLCTNYKPERLTRFGHSFICLSCERVGKNLKELAAIHKLKEGIWITKI